MKEVAEEKIDEEAKRIMLLTRDEIGELISEKMKANAQASQAQEGGLGNEKPV